MRALILLAVVVVVRGTAVQLAAVEEGQSAQFRSEDNLGNYNFGYNEDHTSGGTFRREAGDAHGNVAGSYGLKDADGRIRIVNYIANDDGFKVDIKTNEPGVEPKDTADATFNKAESVIVQAAAPEPYVAVPLAEEPIAYKTEQVAVEAAPAFPVAAAVPVAKTISHPVAIKTEQHVFPPYQAVPAVKSSVVAQPVAYAFPEPAPVPVAKTSTVITTAETKPVAYAFPAPAAVPVAKSHTTTITETKPVAYAFPAPAAVPVAKTIAAPVAVAQTYAFPAPAAVPVAKSSTTTTVTETKPIPYAFPAPAAVAAVKSHSTTITQTHPATYSFPEPAAVPVAKTIAAPVAVAQSYAFPAPAAVPVAKTHTTVTETRPVSYAFPAPAAVPVAKSIAVAETAPVAYTFPAAAAPVAKSGYAYTTEVRSAPAAIAYAPRYALNTIAAPVYRPLYSPAIASFAGPVPYFSNIEYHGYPVVKK